MVDFINTVDALGDEVVLADIISRRITDYKDNFITYLGVAAFRQCYNLLEVNCPKATGLDTGVFYKCSSLRLVDLGSAAGMHSVFDGCTSLKALILRGANVCGLYDPGCLNATPIKSGTGYIYVPAALVDKYKVATNWVNHAAQFLPLEDFTVDGTTIGEFVCYSVSNELHYVANSNKLLVAGRVYSGTLTPTVTGGSINSITVTMGGVDVTADVYNAETGEIYIPTVAGDISVTAVCEAYIIENVLSGVTNSNTANAMLPNSAYYAVLTPSGDNTISSVIITMGGVDVTADVYNAETGEISIPIVTGDVKINATTGQTIILEYSVIQGYPATGHVNDKFTTPTGNGAATVCCSVTPGAMIRVSMTEKTTTRFRIGFAKEPLANNVALYHPFTADDTALEKTFVVPDGYTYLMVYLGVTPYPSVEPGFLIEDISGTAGSRNTLKIEQGSIGWDSSEAGKDKQASNVVRTDFIPFSGSSTVSISVPNSTTTYKVTLRGYDAAKTYQKANGPWITLPGTITFAYPYIRVLIGKTDDSDFDVSSLYGAVLTVDGVNYTLVA